MPTALQISAPAAFPRKAQHRQFQKQRLCDAGGGKARWKLGHLPCHPAGPSPQAEQQGQERGCPLPAWQTAGPALELLAGDTSRKVTQGPGPRATRAQVWGKPSSQKMPPKELPCQLLVPSLALDLQTWLGAGKYQERDSAQHLNSRSCKPPS